MDLVLESIDGLFFDQFYAQYGPAEYFSERDNWMRQLTTILVLWILGGWLLYLTFATASYVFLFDKSLKNHKLYLPNQIQQEILVSMTSIPIMAVPSSFIFLAEVRGYSKLYMPQNDLYELFFLIATIPFYLFFTDTFIYWIHRILHLPLFYAPIHKLHHKWIISTPFASHAFHPLDGFSQSLPYHIYVFLVPMNKIAYVLLFFFVNMWTISIHDNVSFYRGKILNGAEHHTIHHRQFNYNYGQYFTLWDKLFGTHKLDTKKE